MEMNQRFSTLLMTLLSHLSGSLTSAVLGDFLFKFGSINISSQYGRCAGPYCSRCPGILNIQNVCVPIPSTINLENLALPLRTRELPAGPLISPLPFSAKAQVQRL
jgi:hypothetical protein